MIDLSPLLKVSARLLDLHDSSRGPGASIQYQIEERPGRKDGSYVAIASEVLTVLQESGKRSGDEYASVDFVVMSVRESLHWANEMDVEFVLNVLSRPTELKLLQTEEESSHVIGDKDTNLVEKAAHLSEYRLSRLGRKALAMATDNLDLAYVEGDVTKLLRALEAGKLKQAMHFLDRLIDQLRTEQLILVSIIEKTSGGRKVWDTLFDDLESFEATIRRAAELVSQAQAQVNVLARGAGPKTVDQEVPFGLLQDRVRELQRGIVGYSRRLSELASKSLSAISTSVPAPSFAKLALHMVITPPTGLQTDFILSEMGPVFSHLNYPIVTDLRASVKTRTVKVAQHVSLDLGEFSLPPEDRFLEWMHKNQTAFNERIGQGKLSLEDAINLWASEDGLEGDFGCVVAALTSPDEWLSTEGVQGTMDAQLTISKLPTASVMHSRLSLAVDRLTAFEETPDDTI